MLLISTHRVGSHMVFALIHCTDVRIHCTDILIECRKISLCFLIYTQKVIHLFQPTFPPIKRYQDSIFKLLTLSTNLVTIVVRTAYFQIQARSSPLKNCDRVCTQSKKLYEDILASLDRGKWRLENGV